MVNIDNRMSLQDFMDKLTPQLEELPTIKEVSDDKLRAEIQLPYNVAIIVDLIRNIVYIFGSNDLLLEEFDLSKKDVHLLALELNTLMAHEYMALQQERQLAPAVHSFG